MTHPKPAPEEKADMAKEQFYYIQDSRSFHGNAVVWWGIKGGGYTSNIQRAGRYNKQEAAKIVNSRKTDIAWPCEHIDKNEKAKITIVDMQYLDYKKQRRRLIL